MNQGLIIIKTLSLAVVVALIWSYIIKLPVRIIRR